MKTWVFFLFFLSSLYGNHLQKNEKELASLYHSLKPNSLKEKLVFYQLFPDTSYGRQALQEAWQLLNKHRIHPLPTSLDFSMPKFDLQGIISIVNYEPFRPSVVLTKQQLETIKLLSNELHNRSFLGAKIWEVQKLKTIPAEEIDLARAILLHQYENDPNAKHHILQYEANLDLMALQVLAMLPPNASDEEKVQAINHFIFFDMRFRFPPHSEWPDEVDLYTFLPSVIDSRKGICLGVSNLYLCIAQRLGLPLEIITPPGHIYLRLRKENKTINIETTARGVSYPDSTYLGINTYKLQQRNIKEVIGLNFINQAAKAWKKQQFEDAKKLYLLAKEYLPHDPLLTMFLGYSYYFTGDETEGKKYLQTIYKKPFDDAVTYDRSVVDLYDRKVDQRAIQCIYEEVEPTRDATIQKQNKLKKWVKKYPKFRDGYFHIAITYLQLGREKEALKYLNLYHALDPKNPIVEYYLAILNLNRIEYQKAKEHYLIAKKYLARYNHEPEAFKNLYLQLKQADPIRSTQASQS